MKCSHCGQTIKKPKTEDIFLSARRAELIEHLTAAYLDLFGVAYGFMPRDAAEVSKLLKLCPDNEGILCRWRWALEKSRSPFHSPKVHKLADLVIHWNAYPAVKAVAPDRIEGGL